MENSVAMINLSDNQLMTISRTADLPSGYKGKEGNVLLAYEFSQRKGLPLLHVIQNMHFIQGTPSWKAEYQRAMLNRSGYIKPPIQYKWNENHTACKAVVTLKTDGTVVEGPEVSLEMAQKEGWTKNAKWQSIPEIMLMNRASTFLIRYYFADVLDGYPSTDEAEDIAAMQNSAPIEYEDKTENTNSEPKIEAKTEQKDLTPKQKMYMRAVKEVGKDGAIQLCTDTLNALSMTSAALTEENLSDVYAKMLQIILDKRNEERKIEEGTTDVEEPF